MDRLKLSLKAWGLSSRSRIGTYSLRAGWRHIPEQDQNNKDVSTAGPGAASGRCRPSRDFACRADGADRCCRRARPRPWTGTPTHRRCGCVLEWRADWPDTFWCRMCSPALPDTCEPPGPVGPVPGHWPVPSRAAIGRVRFIRVTRVGPSPGWPARAGTGHGTEHPSHRPHPAIVEPYPCRPPHHSLCGPGHRPAFSFHAPCSSSEPSQCTRTGFVPALAALSPSVSSASLKRQKRGVPTP